MTAAVGTAARFDLGKVVERTFAAIGRNFAVFALLSLMLAGVPAAFTGAAVTMLAAGGAPGLPSSAAFGAAALGGAAISYIVQAIAAYILQGAITYGAVADLNGRKPTLGECLSTGVRHAGWLFLLAVVATVATVFGYLLLIVPGLMIATAWLVAAPAQVVERTGVFGALSRSADLTRGHRWPVFGLMVAYGLGAFMVQSVVIGVISAVAMGSPANARLVAQVFLTPIVTTITGLVAAVGVASVYYELRSVREGVGPEALAAVFD